MKIIEDVINEASKCLQCKNPKCIQGCPIANNIPEFIKEVKSKNFLKAYEILQQNNVMSEICSIVCPVEKQCMGKCVRGIKSATVKINDLEKFVNVWAKENNIKYNIPVEHNINKKVAIIGSGPAGIACGVELRKAGADVTIFEKEDKCGGVLRYGIPDFRLPKEIVDNVVLKIKNSGIKIKNGIEFGKDISIESLKTNGFEYVFLAFGTGDRITFNLSNQTSNNIYKSDEILKAYSKGEIISNLETTVVIGGGNVAIDTARTVLRMGATKSYIIYRRNKDQMPARESELQQAIKDGVEIMFQTKVYNAKIENGQIKSVDCIKTNIEDGKVIDIEDSNFTINCDTVIFAIGAKVDEKLLNKQGINSKEGLIYVDENYKTNINNVYAGGDLVEAKASVAKAIATGKKVAIAIIGNV